MDKNEKKNKKILKQMSNEKVNFLKKKKKKIAKYPLVKKSS